jgi:hypothetical protein
MSGLLTMSEELGMSGHLEGGDKPTSDPPAAGKGNSGDEGRLDPAPRGNDFCAHATTVPETR